LEGSEEKYDMVVFSSSFMVLPYKQKAVEIAKSLLSPKGRVVFMMTIHEKVK